MPSLERFEAAIAAFDIYNSRDPNTEAFQGKLFPKELLYAFRMTERLENYAFAPPEYLKLAARCQHIGRWEIPRSSYSADRKGYHQWRNRLKKHHSIVAEGILKSCGYEESVIDIIKSLLLKNDLAENADMHVLEDVICLVFLEHYIEEFASKYEDARVIDILKKTMQKMSSKAIDTVAVLSLSDKIKKLIYEASIAY